MASSAVAGAAQVVHAVRVSFRWMPLRIGPRCRFFRKGPASDTQQRKDQCQLPRPPTVRRMASSLHHTAGPGRGARTPRELHALEHGGRDYVNAERMRSQLPGAPERTTRPERHPGVASSPSGWRSGEQRAPELTSQGMGSKQCLKRGQEHGNSDRKNKDAKGLSKAISKVWYASNSFDFSSQR
jgi:hypothetical protein